MTCRKCGVQCNGDLCQVHKFDDQQEWHEKRAEEMGAGTIRTGPGADEVTTIGRETKQLKIAAEEGIPEAEKRLQELFLVRNSSDEPSGGDRE